MQTQIALQLLRTLRSQWWPASKISAWQDRALLDMMRHAVTNVPFYRELGIPAETISSAADLQRFPIIRKRRLQTDPGKFLADGASPATLHSSRTSGSTGEPTVTYFDDDCWALCKYALKMRRIAAVTSPFFRRCLIVSEQPPAQTDEYRMQRPFGSGVLYSERLVSLFEDLPTHVQVIRDYRPNMLYAFPSYLLELALTYERSGVRPPRIPTIFTSSEVLTPVMRKRIETAFGCHLLDLYGSTEFKEVAWQCKDGGYHINFESVYVETHPDAPDPAQATIVLSTLCNRAMPLLRFDTADIGYVHTSPCACGRQSPLLKITSGREGDVVELPSGRRLSPYLLTTVVEVVPGVHQYRICHDQPAHLTIEMLAAESLGNDALNDCRKQLLEVLGEPFGITFQPVACIDRKAGGKHKVFVRSW